MSNPERDRRFDEIFDAHDAAIAAFRATRGGIADAIDHQVHATAALSQATADLSRAMAEMGTAIRSGDAALAQIQVANRAALALLRSHDEGDTP